MSFSQRNGLVPEKTIQKDSMDDDLRNGLWNMLIAFCWSRQDDGYHEGRIADNLLPLFAGLWGNFFKLPFDTMDEMWDSVHQKIRNEFFEFDWNRVYDFLEFVGDNDPVLEDEEEKREFMAACNRTLEREVSAYRFVGGVITEVTSDEEIAEIEEALVVTDPYGPVRVHLNTALKHMSDRKAPDYRNSIKESISAVESICSVLVDKRAATLGAALSVMQSEHGLHGALKSGFSSLYGYTSDADGIRHALLDEDALEFEDAKFMLVACSAFVNYLIAKMARNGS